MCNCNKNQTKPVGTGKVASTPAAQGQAANPSTSRIGPARTATATPQAAPPVGKTQTFGSQLEADAAARRAARI